MIAVRLLSIAFRRFSAEPTDRAAAARMILLNAARIAREHLGDKEAAEIALQALTEDRQGRAA